MINKQIAESAKLTNNTSILVAITLFVATLPLTFRLAGVSITPADPLFVISFGAVLFTIFKSKTRLSLSLPVAIFSLLYILANLVSQSGKAGFIESAQRIEQLIIGVVIFSFLMQNRPKFAKFAIGAGVVSNLIVASIQAISSGLATTQGLFQSPTAFSFFLCLAILWLLPAISEALPKKYSIIATIPIILIPALFITHGQLLIIFIIILLVTAFINSKKCGIAAIISTIILLGTFGIISNSTISKRFTETLSPYHNGQLKQCHTEVIAAMRMAKENSLAGIGAGHYQEQIGTYYRELRNPNRNEIEADTQSGYGILFGSSGIIVGFAFIVLLIIHFIGSLKEKSNLGSIATITFIFFAMLISDPFIKGTSWMLVLALSSSYSLFHKRCNTIHILATTALLGILTFLIPLAKASNATKPPTIDNTKADPSNQNIIDIFKVIDSSIAKVVTKPMVVAADMEASLKSILHIPDHAGKPNDDDKPAMEYGGAEFDITMPAQAKCHLWIRVWWAGSCGNSLYLNLNSAKKPLVFGNDCTYKRWHWYKTKQLFTFQKGSNKLQVLNREDGIKVDQILITNDLEYVPQGIEEE